MPSIAEQAERPDVSTGHLPEPETVQKLVSHAHRRFKSNTDGQNSQVYPALAGVPSELFGVCAVGSGVCADAAGGIESEFSIMSVSKPICVWISFGSTGFVASLLSMINSTGRREGACNGRSNRYAQICLVPRSPEFIGSKLRRTA